MAQPQEGGMQRRDDDLLLPQDAQPQTGEQVKPPPDAITDSTSDGTDSAAKSTSTDAKDEANPAGPKPGATATLVIRRTDSIWPVKMAELATGDARRYIELNGLNPDKCQNGNWRDLWAGDEIVMPREWAPHLMAAGYLIKGSNQEPAKAVPSLDIESPQNGGVYSVDSPPRMTFNIHSLPGDKVGLRGALWHNGKFLFNSDVQNVCDENGNVRWDDAMAHNKGPGTYELDLFAYNDVGSTASHTAKFTIVEATPQKREDDDDLLVGDDNVE
jgi:hypothetical protein